MSITKDEARKLLYGSALWATTPRVGVLRGLTQVCEDRGCVACLPAEVGKSMSMAGPRVPTFPSFPSISTAMVQLREERPGCRGRAGEAPL